MEEINYLSNHFLCCFLKKRRFFFDLLGRIRSWVFHAFRFHEHDCSWKKEVSFLTCGAGIGLGFFLPLPFINFDLVDVGQFPHLEGREPPVNMLLGGHIKNEGQLRELIRNVQRLINLFFLS